MNEQLSQEEVTNKTNDKPWLFKKGNPGGPGRPIGKSMKEYSREYLAKMTDEERQEFLNGIPKVEIWKLAEGQPHQSNDTTVEVKPSPLLNAISNNPSNNKDSQPKEENTSDTGGNISG